MRAQKSFGEVVYQSFWQSVATLELTVDSLVDTFRGRYGLSALSGPVGIGEQVGEVISSGETVSGTVLNIASMTVLISMSLGVFNLLPIPVLDGGRILFYIIEAIRRKPMDPKYEKRRERAVYDIACVPYDLCAFQGYCGTFLIKICGRERN